MNTDRKSDMRNEFKSYGIETGRISKPDYFALLQKHAEDFGLLRVAQMVRLAPRSSPLYNADFKHTPSGAWSLKPRPGVAPEAAARELCRLLGVL